LGVNPTLLNSTELQKDRIVPLKHNDHLVLIKDKSHLRYHIKLLIQDHPSVTPLKTPIKQPPQEPNEPRTDDEGENGDEEEDEGAIPRRWRVIDFSEESDDVVGGSPTGLSERGDRSPAPILSSPPPTIPLAIRNIAFLSSSSNPSRTPRSSSPRVSLVRSAQTENDERTPTAIRNFGVEPLDTIKARRETVDNTKGKGKEAEDMNLAETDDGTLKAGKNSIGDSGTIKPKRGRPAASGAEKKKPKSREGTTTEWTLETRREAVERWRREKEEKLTGKRKRGGKAPEEGNHASEDVHTEEDGKMIKNDKKKTKTTEAKERKTTGKKKGVTAYGVYSRRRRSELSKSPSHPVDLAHQDPTLTAKAITQLLRQEFAALDAKTLQDLKSEASNRSTHVSSSSSSDESN
ncbi:hypothetical protein HDU67_004576, partial [Dinochytrium kinnereticum]